MAEDRDSRNLLMTVGDRSPVLTSYLTTPDGTLTMDATATVRMRLTNAITGKVALDDVAAEVTDYTNGAVRYQWGTSDTSVSGYYNAQWDVCLSSGRHVHTRDTFPVMIREKDGNIRSDWLFTIAAAKAWLGHKSSDADLQLRLAIPTVTRFMGNVLGYNLIDQTYTHDGTTLKKLDGNGRATMYLRQRPVTSVSALTIRYEQDVALTDADRFALTNDGIAGRMDLLDGRVFPRAIQNIGVTYRAGWTIYDNSMTEWAPSMPEEIFLVGMQQLQKVLIEWDTKAPAVTRYEVAGQTVELAMKPLSDTQRAMLAPYMRVRL